MTLQRLPDWPQRLGALVQARLAQPFAWGPNDCASFAAAAVQVMTGHDVLAELRGHRVNQRQAMRRERAIGGIPAAIQRAGLAPVAPALARRGDLVMVPMGARRRALAVCNGDEAVAPGVDRLESVPMRLVDAAWRV